MLRQSVARLRPRKAPRVVRRQGYLHRESRARLQMKCRLLQILSRYAGCCNRVEPSPSVRMQPQRGGLTEATIARELYRLRVNGTHSCVSQDGAAGLGAERIYNQ